MDPTKVNINDSMIVQHCHSLITSIISTKSNKFISLSLVDHNNNKDKKYAIAGANDTDGGTSATATLTTPGFKGLEHPEECLLFWYNINTNGIDDALEVHKLDNDNNQATNLWSLPSPGESGWQQGRVKVHSDGDRMYQVTHI